MEDRGPDRQRRLWPPVCDSVDRFRTSPEKRDSLRFLGVQRAGESVDAKLFRYLPKGFSGRSEHGNAASYLSAKSLLSLYPSVAPTPG